MRAGLIGLILAWPVVALGTLFPSMAAHALIDILAFLRVWPLMDRLAPHRGSRPPEGP